MDTTDTRDLREDTDADTRDEEQQTEESEQQVVEDTDADTADVSRKLDSLMESVSALSQIIAQMSRDYGSGTTNASGEITTQADVADGDVALEDLDYSLD